MNEYAQEFTIKCQDQAMKMLIPHINFKSIVKEWFEGSYDEFLQEMSEKDNPLFYDLYDDAFWDYLPPIYGAVKVKYNERIFKKIKEACEEWQEELLSEKDL